MPKNGKLCRLLLHNRRPDLAPNTKRFQLASVANDSCLRSGQPPRFQLNVKQILVVIFAQFLEKMNSCGCQREVVITDNLGLSVNLP